MPTPRKARPVQLTREDWVDAAIEMLIHDGVDAVQITGLARALKITRGSFYWHFEARDDLLDAVVEEWQRRNTGVILRALEKAGDLDEGLLALFQIWVDRTDFDPTLDQAVREWARRSEALLEKVRIEDDNRVSGMAAFLEQHGFEATEAFVRARIIYFTQVSYYALGVREPMAVRLSYLDAYFKSFIGRAPAATAAEAFIKMQEGRTE
ncbi:TetR/AcrR family transcriptional regulator [Kiloniella sp. b19]|uniref:TetR/AcrR family transcriptional regulator n=1 Tax=Kiloniella sp. GXU_MW_B19 TaxID=3141326 RepID=UPI0031E2D0BA